MCGSGSALERKVTSTHEASMVRELQKQTFHESTFLQQIALPPIELLQLASKRRRSHLLPSAMQIGRLLADISCEAVSNCITSGASKLFRLQSKFMVRSDLQTMAVRSVYRQSDLLLLPLRS